VNTAARMQSTGEYMRVQMSPYIHQEYMRVTNNVDGLGFEERKVTAKGKGELTTYLVVPNRDRATTATSDAIERMTQDAMQQSMRAQMTMGTSTRALVADAAETTKAEKVTSMGEENVALSMFSLRFLEAAPVPLARGRSARRIGDVIGGAVGRRSSETPAPETARGDGPTPEVKFEEVSGSDLERRFARFMTRQRLRDVRFGFTMLAIFMFVVGVADITRLETEDGYLLPIIVRLGTSIVALIGLFLTLNRWFRRIISLTGIVIYVLAGAVIPLASTTLKRENMATQSVVGMMLFYALVGNISGVNYIDVVAVNLLTLVTWCAVFWAGQGPHLGNAPPEPVLIFRWSATTPEEVLADAVVAGNVATTPGGSHDKCVFPLANSSWLDYCEAFDSTSFVYFLAFLLVSNVLNLSARRISELYARRKFVLLQRLKQETQKTDEFLYRMLPEAVVAQMKQNIQVADEFDNIFILASDIVGFTKMAAASEPRDVVAILSQLFCSFDIISESMGVYKVMTIGDAYIAVTGMVDEKEGESSTSGGRTPAARKRQAQAVALTNFSLVMLNEIAKVAPPNERCAPLNMRIGLHVGRVVAGVIGTKKLRYDIWGTDVLTAVKMESNGIPGEVCVSDTMRKYLEGSFSFELHKNVELTGFNKDGSKKTIDSHKLVRKSAEQAKREGVGNPRQTSFSSN